MKITVNTKSFIDAIGWTVKSMDSKDQDAFIVLETDENSEGSLSHTNSFSYMKAPFEVVTAEDASDNKLALSGQFLSKLVPALNNSGDTVNLELTEKSGTRTLNLKGKTGRFSIPIHGSRIPKKPETEKLGEVSDTEYFDYILRLTKLCAADTEGLMPALGAVDVKLSKEDESLVMMASDRYALGEITLDFEPANDFEDDDERHYLIPHGNSGLISPTRGSSDSIELVFDKNSEKFGYRLVDGREALFVLKDADPMTYKNIKSSMSDMVEHSIVTDRKELTKAISIMASLSWDEDDTFITIDPNEGLVVHDSHKTNKMNVSSEDVSADQEYSLQFVREIIEEAFAPINTAKVKIEWGSSDSTPVVLTPILDSGDDDESVFVSAATI